MILQTLVSLIDVYIGSSILVHMIPV